NLKNRRVPDRYARWCERTENKIIIFLLLDIKIILGVINSEEKDYKTKYIARIYGVIAKKSANI
ncbi:hypothetical protein, partial [Clostridium disporicum]|uniref:hypothetical protein n=1 Tax=Clostridium disporicum TaxID=84024 RepID=UPI001A9A45A8